MPRHPPYALLHLITYYNPNLMRSIFFNKIFYDIFRQKDITSHYPVFKELVEREHSFKTKQNILFAELFVRILIFLHRKEVIHPHVLVGIPCYDFTPITCPTLNGPLLKG